MSNCSTMVVSDENNAVPPRRTTAVLECAHCRRKFLNDADRLLHIREVHLGIKENFECKQCGKQFGNRHILQLHTRLHASQTALPEGGPTDAVTVTSAKQSNGSLNINFNVSLNINLSDGLDPLDLDSKLNELLANATKASFQEALRREKIEKLTNQLKNELLEANKSIETSPSKSSESSEGELSTKNSVSSPSPPPASTPSTPIAQEKPTLQTDITEVVPMPKPITPPPPKPPVRVNPHNRPKKAVGLTKIRMEDCQRCDACSCIYLDERDYIKHMKNFHKQDVLKQEPIKPKNKPRARNQSQSPQQARRSKRQQRYMEQQQQQTQEQGGKKGNCRSCCKSCKCRGDHGTLEPMLPIVRPVLGRAGRRGSCNTQDSWNQFAQHLQGAEAVVVQPDLDNMPDFSHLLSQVEVKIKTEPTEQEEPPAVNVKVEPVDDMDSDSCSVY
ncbi:phospholipase D A-like isoform X2 [Thrips palmi]|uniref:Phospholipase D A-like isoform X2 n=1 Tax=Thrips palmi TaxID=161013 RepID=A0A6P8YUI5_THRPL|nr:phospholipase D A-like isoform X2 [Thrips palmi]